jgi:hypothetical protein
MPGFQFRYGPPLTIDDANNDVIQKLQEIDSSTEFTTMGTPTDLLFIIIPGVLISALHHVSFNFS